MKVIIIIVSLWILAACSSQPSTAYIQSVTPITQTDGCRFITTAYFEVSHPSKMHNYAVKNTLQYGGDSYIILSSDKEQTLFALIYTTNIGVYDCSEIK